ncbi:hypothetical protein [Kitasatospora brasiliensis]|uniref:hypothetical protein n=1 Tax=Kitasatospora brasiliensis TaxID=3058040 RepID=UPI00292F576D|nr:hypothetical protein [Kitasatospora sp. K002]
MRTSVTEIRARQSTQDPWELVRVLPGSEQDTALLGLMLSALDSPTILDLVAPGSRRKVDVHPDPCPLCHHRAQPGPRAYGFWNTDAQLAAEYEQGWRDVDRRSVIELPNPAAADAWMHDIAERFVRRGGGFRRAELTVFQVPATHDRPARYDLLIAAADSELWLWHRRPTSRTDLRTPDRVLRLAADGSVVTLTGEEAAGHRPVVKLPKHESPSKVVEGVGGRELGWFDDGGAGLLVSVLDPASSAAAIRVLAGGEEELGNGVRGLRVFGRYVGDRPPLTRVADLAPDFVDLVPTIPRRKRG